MCSSREPFLLLFKPYLKGITFSVIVIQYASIDFLVLTTNYLFFIFKMLTNATTTHALQMRCVKITLDHSPAHATMDTLEMDSHAEVRFPITSVAPWFSRGGLSNRPCPSVRGPSVLVTVHWFFLIF